MTEVSTDQLKQTVEHQHGGTATLVESLPVKDEFQGTTVWEGVVHVFNAVIHDGYAGRVVSPVLELLETLENEWCRIAATRESHNPAHNVTTSG